MLKKKPGLWASFKSFGSFIEKIRSDSSLVLWRLLPLSEIVREIEKSTDLHADDAVYEEDESYEDGYPGQGLEGFDEGPEEGPDALALA